MLRGFWRKRNHPRNVVSGVFLLLLLFFGYVNFSFRGPFSSPTTTSSQFHPQILLPQQQGQLSMQTEFDIDPSDMETKYLVYQPSGGWGNQRMILRWAMRAANAMERTLIVPNIAPHNMMWYGYDRINASECLNADQVLEMKALEAGLVKGVRVYRGHLRDLIQLLPGAWRRHTTKSTVWMKANAIRSRWKGLPERVIFFRKGSMWECCGGGELMNPYIVFSQELRDVSHQLASKLFGGPHAKFNAAHVRRAGGHTRIERRSALHFIDLKLRPHNMLSLPLYIATDEKNASWFDPIHDALLPGNRVFLWKDVESVAPQETSEFLAKVPIRMRNDVIGFLEQLICARAQQFAGSEGSTFSFAISGMRAFPHSLTTARNVDWKLATSGVDVFAEANVEDEEHRAEDDGEEEDDVGEKEEDEEDETVNTTL